MYRFLTSSTFLHTRMGLGGGRKNQETETLSRSGRCKNSSFVFFSMIGYGSYSLTTAVFSFKSFHLLSLLIP